ncbi:MAG TPA: hypothetical protein VNT53_04555 [Pseudolysinimonas sp.]|nr:hypothetical protein [Pseudolysinimonas sp.]
MGTVVALALIVAGVGVVSVSQGPRVQGAQLDAAAAVQAPASLRFVINEAVAPIRRAQVKVSHRVPVTVVSDGGVVLVKFGIALAYDTDYVVSISDVRSVGGGASSTLTHEFRTPPLGLDWLQRGVGGDSILHVEAGRTPGKPTVLFRGDRIQDFLPLGDAVLVVSLAADGTNKADIVATDGPNRESLALPGPGTVGLLEYSGTSVLYTFSSTAGAEGVPEFSDTLFRLDLSGTHESVPVTGINGAPLSVDGIHPVAGSTRVVLHSRAGEALLWDTASTDPPSLIGAFAELSAVSGDGARLAATDAAGPSIVTLGTGREERITPSPLPGGVPYIADVIPLRGGRHLERVALPSADFRSFELSVAIDNGTTANVLFRAAGRGSILSFEATANEQYVIAEVSPGGVQADTDGYGSGARPTDVTIVVLDVATGRVVAERSGSHARW